MHRSHAPRWVALAPVLVTAACEANQDPFVGDVSRSKYWEYHDQVTESLCPNLLPLIDEHTETIGRKIGLSPDPNHPFRYFKFDDPAALEAACQGGGDVGGCAYADVVYAPTYFHAHEQAHDYAHRAWGGWSVGLLDEGEAVSLSCAPFLFVDPSLTPMQSLGSPSWQSMLGAGLYTAEGETAAGYLTTYLADRYGWTALGELHQNVPYGTSPEDFALEFARVFPESVDDAWAAALSTPGASHCQKDWLCGAPPLTDGEDIPYCDGQIHRTVDVGAGEAGLVFGIGGPVLGWGGGIGLVACQGGGYPWYTLESNTETAHWAFLPAGAYSVVTDGVELGLEDAYFTSPPTHVALRDAIPAGTIGSSCETAGVVLLDDDRTTYIDFLQYALSGWIRLSGAPGEYSVGSYFLQWEGDTGATPTICDSCGPSAMCVSLPIQYWTDVDLGPESVLFIPPNGISSPPPTTGEITFFPLAALGLDAGDASDGNASDADATGEGQGEGGADGGGL